MQNLNSSLNLHQNSNQTSTMKKLKVTTFLSACLVGLSPMQASTYEADGAQNAMHRPFYGYFHCNLDWPDYEYGFAEQYFDYTLDSEQIYSLKDGRNVSLYAGAAIDGIIYGCEYQFTNSMENPTPIDFIAYNIYTGRIESLGQWNDNPTSTFKPTDMTYDYSSKTMYAVGYELGTAAIYTVDITNGKFTHVRDIEGAGTLAANAKGELYTISHDGWLKKINLSNGNLENVFNTGLTSMGSSQTMEFDLTTGNLYWASNTMSRDNCENVWLQEIDMSDPDNITIRELGRLGKNAMFRALYIPYADSLDAPAAPTEIKATTDPSDPGKAILTWRNPDKTFSGADLDNLLGVVIFRDGVQCKYFSTADVTKGANMSWTDDAIPANGEYRYDIVAFNEYGNGAKGVAYQYIGKDSPAQVTNISCEVQDGCGSALLSWNAPEIGAHGCDIDGSELSYTVIRRPDNLTVAENIKATEFRDENFRRLLRYYYEIECSNGVGKASTAKSADFVAGPALEIPFEEQFEDVEAMNNQWSNYDANNDMYSWLFGTTLGHSTFGDYESAAEYILSPTSVDETVKDADEWLITPPIEFSSDKEYDVVVSARSISAEDLEIAFGKNNTVEAMSKVGEITVTPAGLDETTGTMKIVNYIVTLPKVDENTIGCAGVHLVSAIPFNLNSYLQINAVRVVEKGTFSSVSDIESDGVALTLSGRVLIIDGDFTEARIYGINGSLACETTAGNIDLSNLQQGVYIVAVDTASGRENHKIVIR